ncbi:flavin reductase family protein [Mesorhizobium sp. VK9D]|uniref:flavin reductase family protein n=1 Tax=Mesorhizobium australafricanum TaxID=3072311 RepID=UPI002A23B5AE|nr:flavin reductase family protein [Mesorhizobium sp. VK9D]MDX8454963.1 flavin reductase family protein [Mesorhizobium sp. VK9D]
MPPEGSGERFSGFGGIKGKDRYEGAEWTTLNTGASLLTDAVTAFDCSLDEMIDRGTHSIVLGSVEAGQDPGCRAGVDLLAGWLSATRCVR